MPTVTLDKKQVLKHIGKNFSDKQLEERIPLIGVDLEEINNNEIITEIFPDRPDMMSEAGFGRALRSFFDVKLGLKKYKIVKSKERVIVDKNLKNVRPYTAVALVKGLNFNDEKIKEVVQLQEKLHVTYGKNRQRCAIGIYPFENIKTPIRFKAMKPEEIVFKPLDSNKEMNGYEILDNHPKGKEYGYLLKKYKNYPVFIDSDNRILSLTPIINSEYTGRVTSSTKDVFVEVSGHNYEICKGCLNMIVSALSDMGGKVNSMSLEYPGKKINSPDLNPEKFNISKNYLNKIVGMDLTDSNLKKYLGRMGYEVKGNTVYIPAYRVDILHQIDIAEDIAVGYGYDQFNEEIPRVSTLGQEDKFEKFKGKLANVLVGLNFLESYTFSLSNTERLNYKMGTELNVVRLKNALTEDYNSLRNWMIPSLLEVLSNNKHHEYPQNLFEIGSVFLKGKSETGVFEEDRLCVVLCHSKANFTESKQVLDSVLGSLGVNFKIKEGDHKSFIPGRVGDVIVGNKKIGVIGEVHPSVLTSWDLDMPVSCFELDAKALFGLLK